MKNKGFTLIELLVVIAIIGILSSVVLASLNSARVKGQEAAVKLNFRNAMPQAELSYDTVGDYSGACTAIAKMLTAVNNTGASTSCYSLNSPGQLDVYLRWGASARKSDNTKNWSVSGTSVVTWDTADMPGSPMTWAAAGTACSALGKRLPTLEELKSLSDAYTSAGASITANPPGFLAGLFYWSGNIIPLSGAAAHQVIMDTGLIGGGVLGSSKYVRCVQ